MQHFFKVIRMHRYTFLSQPGIVSVGFGFKTKNKINTGVPSLIIGVENKLPLHAITDDHLIPSFIDHLPTDVIELGKIKMLGYALPNPGYSPEEQVNRKGKVRPAQPGVSIGHLESTAGTFGAVVRGDFQDGIAILSNNHILANSSDGLEGISRPGDAVLQPGPYDHGRKEDIIAHLHSFSPLIPEKEGKTNLNTIDAALAVPLKTDLVDSNILGLGRVSLTARAYPGMLAFKSGRSSAVTSGRIFSTGNTIRVENGDKKYVFEDQIGFTAISKPGDSGSLVVSQFGRALGLLFAGSEKYSFVNPIERILDYFRVYLI